MKYLLFTQDNGRGHLAQTLVLKEKLESRGHQIVAVIIGSKKGAKLPQFFTEQFSGLTFAMFSPYFITDRKDRGIKIIASIGLSLLHIPRYLASIKKIKEIVKELKPDILINCYEPLAGLYYRFHRVSQPMFCIGHQYFIDHPSFTFPSISALAKRTLKVYNLFTAPRSVTRVTLSFTKEEDLPQQNLIICPPLIRSIIKNSHPENQGFILAYILNPGYGEEIKSWCQKNPATKVEVFREQSEKEISVINNLTFHNLSGEKFINHLVNCAAYASTGGFESISEAAYLQKSILMVPTRGQFEQKCNATDAQRAGLAQTANKFDLSPLILNQTKTHPRGQSAFKEWVDDYGDKIVNILEQKTKL